MPLKFLNGQLTTVGAGLITGSLLKGQVITRSGPTGAFVDTTDTATNLIAAFIGLYNVGTTADPINFVVTYINTTAYVATLAAGSGVTLTSQAPTPTSGTLTVAANSAATIFASVAPASGTVALTIMKREAVI